MTPPPQDDLLARFSKRIDLPAYLVQRGYEVVAERQERRLHRDGTQTAGQILLVAKKPDGRGWMYRSATDPRDRGSVAEYLQRHERLSTASPHSSGSSRASTLGVVDVPEAERYRAYLRDKPRALLEAETRHARHVRASSPRIWAATSTCLGSGPPSSAAPRRDLTGNPHPPHQPPTQGHQHALQQILRIARGTPAFRLPDRELGFGCCPGRRRGRACWRRRRRPAAGHERPVVAAGAAGTAGAAGRRAQPASAGTSGAAGAVGRRPHRDAEAAKP